MKRAPSALMAIGGFGVAVTTLSVAATAAIVLLAPQPPALRVSPTAAVAALRGETQGFERRYAVAPPPGPRTAMLEQMIAAELRRPPADVRVVWLDDVWKDVSVRPPNAGVALRRDVREVRPTAFVLVERQKGKFETVAGTAATGKISNLLFGLPMPAFAASLRESDGRWLNVEPVRPFLGGWQVSILIALAVSLLLLAPLAWLFARRLTRPFRAA